MKETKRTLTVTVFQDENGKGNMLINHDGLTNIEIIGIAELLKNNAFNSTPEQPKISQP